MEKRYIFIGKCLFFPKYKMLVFGDLHLGYEKALRSRGLDVSIGQFKEVEEEINRIFTHINAKYGKVEEVIFLGDIKHGFGFVGEEKEEINKLLRTVKKFVSENKIIFIKGNHEKNEKNEKFIDYYIYKDICFIHGHREFLEMYSKEINLIVMGHIHPTVVLKDKMKVRREKYKCFLSGRYKKKDFVILPSFISATEGVSLSEFDDELSGGYDFSVVPNKEIENFNVFVARELGEDALDFGKLKNIIEKN